MVNFKSLLVSVVLIFVAAISLGIYLGRRARPCIQSRPIITHIFINGRSQVMTKSECTTRIPERLKEE